MITKMAKIAMMVKMPFDCYRHEDIPEAEERSEKGGWNSVLAYLASRLVEKRKEKNAVHRFVTLTETADPNQPVCQTDTYVRSPALQPIVQTTATQPIPITQSNMPRTIQSIHPIRLVQGI